jgi:hypothetical protein
MKPRNKEHRSLVSVRINERFYINLMKQLRSQGHSFAAFIQRAAEVYLDDSTSEKRHRIDNIPVMPHSKKVYRNKQTRRYVA